MQLEELIERCKLTRKRVNAVLLKYSGGQRIYASEDYFMVAEAQIRKAIPIIQKAMEEENSVAVTEAYFRGRQDGLTMKGEADGTD